jgi:hypothetical protein
MSWARYIYVHMYMPTYLHKSGLLTLEIWTLKPVLRHGRGALEAWPSGIGSVWHRGDWIYGSWDRIPPGYRVVAIQREEKEKKTWKGFEGATGVHPLVGEVNLRHQLHVGGRHRVHRQNRDLQISVKNWWTSIFETTIWYAHGKMPVNAKLFNANNVNNNFKFSDVLVLLKMIGSIIILTELSYLSFT